MRSRSRSRAGLIGLGIVWSMALSPGISWAQSEPKAVQVVALSAAEMKVAVQAAEKEIDRLKLRTASPMFLVDTEVLQPKDEKGDTSPRRVARTVHYRYEGDLAIVTFVDLASGRIEKVEQIANLPVPLAPEELAAAKELGLADPEVRRLLGADAGRATVEALTVHTSQRDDRLFGHRVVELLFRVEQGYLAREVLVDLTERKVMVGKPPTERHQDEH